LLLLQGHWERRIVELGGPDYAKTAPKITDSEGNEVTDSRGPGYRWAGGSVVVVVVWSGGRADMQVSSEGGAGTPCCQYLCQCTHGVCNAKRSCLVGCPNWPMLCPVLMRLVDAVMCLQVLWCRQAAAGCQGAV
jgi:hypothetical protein